MATIRPRFRADAAPRASSSPCAAQSLSPSSPESDLLTGLAAASRLRSGGGWRDAAHGHCASTTSVCTGTSSCSGDLQLVPRPRAIPVSSGAGEDQLLALMRRELDLVEQKLTRQFSRLEDQSTRLVEAHVQPMEAKLANLEAQGLSLQFSELNGAVKALQEELEHQCKRGDAAEARSRRWRQLIESEVRANHTDLKREVAELASSRRSSRRDLSLPSSAGQRHAVDTAELNPSVTRKELAEVADSLRQDLQRLAADTEAGVHPAARSSAGVPTEMSNDTVFATRVDMREAMEALRKELAEAADASVAALRRELHEAAEQHRRQFADLAEQVARIGDGGRGEVQRLKEDVNALKARCDAEHRLSRPEVERIVDQQLGGMLKEQLALAISGGGGKSALREDLAECQRLESSVRDAVTQVNQLRQDVNASREKIDTLEVLVETASVRLDAAEERHRCLREEVSDDNNIVQNPVRSRQSLEVLSRRVELLEQQRQMAGGGTDALKQPDANGASQPASTPPRRAEAKAAKASRGVYFPEAAELANQLAANLKTSRTALELAGSDPAVDRPLLANSSAEGVATAVFRGTDEVSGAPAEELRHEVAAVWRAIAELSELVGVGRSNLGTESFGGAVPPSTVTSAPSAGGVGEIRGPGPASTAPNGTDVIPRSKEEMSRDARDRDLLDLEKRILSCERLGRSLSDSQTTEVSLLRNELQGVVQRIDSFEEAAKTFWHESGTAVDRLQVQLENLCKTVHACEQTCQEVQPLLAERASLKKKATVQEQECHNDSDRSQDASELREARADSERRVSAGEEQHRNHSDRFGAVDHDVKALEGRVAQCEHTLASFQGAVVEAAQVAVKDSKGASSLRRCSEKELSALRDDVTSLHRRIASGASGGAELEPHVAELREEVKRLAACVGSQDVETQMTEVRDEIKNLAARLDNRDAEPVELQTLGGSARSGSGASTVGAATAVVGSARSASIGSTVGATTGFVGNAPLASAVSSSAAATSAAGHDAVTSGTVCHTNDPGHSVDASNAHEEMRRRDPHSAAHLASNLARFGETEGILGGALNDTVPLSSSPLAARAQQPESESIPNAVSGVTPEDAPSRSQTPPVPPLQLGAASVGSRAPSKDNLQPSRLRAVAPLMENGSAWSSARSGPDWTAQTTPSEHDSPVSLRAAPVPAPPTPGRVLRSFGMLSSPRSQAAATQHTAPQPRRRVTGPAHTMSDRLQVDLHSIDPVAQADVEREERRLLSARAKQEAVEQEARERREILSACSSRLASPGGLLSPAVPSTPAEPRDGCVEQPAGVAGIPLEAVAAALGSAKEVRSLSHSAREMSSVDAASTPRALRHAPLPPRPPDGLAS